ncbi:MAG: hypothetical protein HZA37_02600, partial [Parcubacteria group bacterium]|nr:hypothetical protein [Parcubacteria group bacterium]
MHWKFATGILAIIILTVGGFFVWNGNPSAEAKLSFAAQIIETAKNLTGQTGNFISGIFQNDGNFRPVGQISLRENNPVEPDAAPQKGEEAGLLKNNGEDAGGGGDQSRVIPPNPRTNQTAQLTAALKTQSQKTAAATEEPETKRAAPPEQRIQQIKPTIAATTTIATTGNLQPPILRECSF